MKLSSVTGSLRQAGRRMRGAGRTQPRFALSGLRERLQLQGGGPEHAPAADLPQIVRALTEDGKFTAEEAFFRELGRATEESVHPDERHQAAINMQALYMYMWARGEVPLAVAGGGQFRHAVTNALAEPRVQCDRTPNQYCDVSKSAARPHDGRGRTAVGLYVLSGAASGVLSGLPQDAGYVPSHGIYQSSDTAPQPSPGVVQLPR